MSMLFQMAVIFIVNHRYHRFYHHRNKQVCIAYADPIILMNKSRLVLTLSDKSIFEKSFFFHQFALVTARLTNQPKQFKSYATRHNIE